MLPLRHRISSWCYFSVIVSWACGAIWLWSTGRPKRFVLAAVKNTHLMDGAALPFRDLVTNFRTIGLTLKVPLIVGVFPKEGVDLHFGELADPSTGVANFSLALEAGLAPCRSCWQEFAKKSDAEMLLVQRVEGFHLESTSIQEREMLLAPDGKATVLRISMCRGMHQHSRADRLVKFLRNQVVPNALEAAGAKFMDRFEVGVLEIEELLDQVREVAVFELSHNDVVTFPIAFIIMMLAAGPMSGMVFMIYPVGLVFTFYFLDIVQEGRWVYCNFLGPPLFLILATALCLDYVLLLLCRFNEDFAASLEATKCATQCSERHAIRTAARSATKAMMEQAGIAVFGSGILLATAFVSIYLFATVVAIAAIGLGGALLIFVFLAVSLSIAPAFLLLFADWCPMRLARSQSSCKFRSGLFIPELKSFCAVVVSLWRSGLTRLAIQRPIAVLACTLLASLPCMWRAVNLRESVDTRNLAPIASFGWRYFEDRLIQSGLPGGLTLPPILILNKQRTHGEQEQVNTSNSPSSCQDLDGLLAAHWPSLVPEGILPLPKGFFPTCALIGSLFCDIDHLIQEVPPYLQHGSGRKNIT